MGSYNKYGLPSQIILCSITWIIIRFSLLPQHLDFTSTLIGDIPTFMALIILLPLNSLVLLPRFCYKRKYLSYILISLLCIFLATLLLYNDLWPWLELVDHGGRRPMHFEDRPRPRFNAPIISFRWLTRGVPIFMAFLFNTLIELTGYAAKKEKLALLLEKEKIATDLYFLKSQTNPHFLFNALNNLYSLAVSKSPYTAESIMQLSEMLRYMVYDSDAPLVSLNAEIKYIKNYIHLKLLKDSRGMNVRAALDDCNENVMIAPLIFIPFIENAFKHSNIENIDTGYIDIKLKIIDKTVIFSVVNSVPRVSFTKDKVGGVGLENIKKRLSLIYPNDRHTLQISAGEDRYGVKLKINL